MYVYMYGMSRVYAMPCMHAYINVTQYVPMTKLSVSKRNE